jgi:hypothetical protein
MAGNSVYIGPTTFTVGVPYDPNYNGIAWSQPAGPGTTVYPQQVTGGGPIDLKPTTELSGFFSYSCSHVVNSPMIFRDVDLSTGKQVVLVCCPQCSTVQRSMTPEEFADPIGNAITIP